MSRSAGKKIIDAHFGIFSNWYVGSNSGIFLKTPGNGYFPDFFNIFLIDVSNSLGILAIFFSFICIIEL